MRELIFPIRDHDGGAKIVRVGAGRERFVGVVYTLFSRCVQYTTILPGSTNLVVKYNTTGKRICPLRTLLGLKNLRGEINKYMPVVDTRNAEHRDTQQTVTK